MEVIKVYQPYLESGSCYVVSTLDGVTDCIPPKFNAKLKMIKFIDSSLLPPIKLGFWVKLKLKVWKILYAK